MLHLTLEIALLQPSMSGTVPPPRPDRACPATCLLTGLGACAERLRPRDPPWNVRDRTAGALNSQWPPGTLSKNSATLQPSRLGAPVHCHLLPIDLPLPANGVLCCIPVMDKALADPCSVSPAGYCRHGQRTQRQSPDRSWARALPVLPRQRRTAAAPVRRFVSKRRLVPAGK